MFVSKLNLEGLTLTDKGITVNLDLISVDTQILDHCLIGRLLSKKEVMFSYFKENRDHIWLCVSITQG